MPLDRKQRENLGKISADLGKLTFAGLVIGALIAKEPMPIWVTIGGFAFSLICFFVTLIIDRERG